MYVLTQVIGTAFWKITILKWLIFGASQFVFYIFYLSLFSRNFTLQFLESLNRFWKFIFYWKLIWEFVKWNSKLLTHRETFGWDYFLEFFCNQLKILKPVLEIHLSLKFTSKYTIYWQEFVTKEKKSIPILIFRTPYRVRFLIENTWKRKHTSKRNPTLIEIISLAIFVISSATKVIDTQHDFWNTVYSYLYYTSYM